MDNTILLIFAHPDDEILGCGATVARLADEGYSIYTLIIGEGITSRDDIRDPNVRSEEIKNLQENAFNANRLIGVKDIVMCNFPDNRFDSLPQIEIVKILEKYINLFNPKIIFTHHANDLNIDHQIIFRSVVTATRPQPGSFVKEIYSCEVLSSTEWNYPQTFFPDTYFFIQQEHLIKKIKALECYKSEIRNYPHPRSVEGIKYLAKLRGLQIGVDFAEGFKLVRRIL